MTPVYEPWDETRGAEIIAEHKHLEGPTLVILHALQEAFGYVPEPAIPMIAAALNLSRAEVHGVFTFYHDFRHQPAGRHVLKLCRAEACQAAGGDALAARAEAKLGISLGNTTPDERVTLEPIYCLGLCATAPSAMLDGRLVGRLDEARLDSAGRGGAAMTIRIFVSRDAGAVAVGADEVAVALEQAAAKRGLVLDIVRTGSRGLYWLEPMVEVATPQGRVAFGPVSEADVASVLDAMIADGPHALRLGVADEIPWLKRQTRLTFARCGVIDPRSVEDYRAHDGYKGLERALTLGSDGDPRRCHDLRIARPWRRRLPDRHQVEDRRADQRRPEIHRLQRRRRRQRHFCRPHDHGRRSLRGDRGHDHRRHRGRRHQGLHLHPLGISARGRGDERRDRGSEARGLSRRLASAAPRTASISKSASAPALMSAARKPRCWKASKAAAASSAPSRRCRRTRACSASRP